MITWSLDFVGVRVYERCLFEHYISIHIYMIICMYIYVYDYMYVYIYMIVCMYIYDYMYVYIYIYTVDINSHHNLQNHVENNLRPCWPARRRRDPQGQPSNLQKERWKNQEKVQGEKKKRRSVMGNII